MQQLVAGIKALDSGIKAIETEINDFGEKVRNMREMLAAKQKALRKEKG
ncbi:MAG: hypothetical protein IJY24_06640 [Clostridia bacterium]|nr:hypothetical protein [Clostridia bacterium]